MATAAPEMALSEPDDVTKPGPEEPSAELTPMSTDDSVEPSVEPPVEAAESIVESIESAMETIESATEDVAQPSTSEVLTSEALEAEEIRDREESTTTATPSDESMPTQPSSEEAAEQASEQLPEEMTEEPKTEEQMTEETSEVEAPPASASSDDPRMFPVEEVAPGDASMVECLMPSEDGQCAIDVVYSGKCVRCRYSKILHPDGRVIELVALAKDQIRAIFVLDAEGVEQAAHFFEETVPAEL